MVFCRECGNNCLQAKFCSKCGAPTGLGASPSSSSPSPSSSSSNTTRPNERGAGGGNYDQKMSVSEHAKALGLTAPGTKERHEFTVNAGPPSKGNCTKCGAPVRGAWMSGDAGIFHKDCWRCGGCNQHLGGAYIDIQGVAYCEGCARGGRRMAKKTGGGPCEGCGGPTDNAPELVTYGERPWHPDCFRCISCGNLIQGGTIYRIGGEMSYQIGHDTKIVGGKPQCCNCGSEWKK